MAQNLEINGVTYNSVTALSVAKSGGGTADFLDTSDADATVSDILTGKTAYVNGSKLTGTYEGGGGGTGWQRPSDWLPIPAFDPAYDEVYILMAVYETDFNPIAFIFGGAYTVDWGDGNSDSYASGATAEHNYDWAYIPSSTLSSEGFRQVLIRVYCTTDTMRTINFNVRHPSFSYAYSASGILEIIGNFSSIDSLAISVSSPNIRHFCVRNIELYGVITQTSMAYMLAYLSKLEHIYLDTSLATTAANMFQNDYCLTNVSELDLQNVLSWNYTFGSCYALQYFNNVTIKGTDFRNMFISCHNLHSISGIDCASVALSTRNLSLIHI